jgi:predicted transcriptional regulator
MPGKRIQLDEETWQALDLLARDTMKDFQELADEALADLLRKYDRPVTLKDALRKSAAPRSAQEAVSAARPPAPRRRTSRRR